jgi:membrane protein YqaA with SNARE-associated domain
MLLEKLIALYSISDLFTQIQYFEYGGMFLVSFLAGIIIVIPIPVLPILILTVISGEMNEYLLALFAAGGSVSAKIVIFCCSYYGRNLLNVQSRAKMLPLQNLINKYGWLAVIITSMTPIPDAPVNIHLGLARYNFCKFIFSAFISKLALYELTVLLLIPISHSISFDSPWILDRETLLLGLFVVAIYIVLIYYSTKIDWAKLLTKWTAKE